MTMNTDGIKETITSNAAEIARLHQRVREALNRLDGSEEKSGQWKQACAEFHARYDALAFPGGYTGAPERISSGDPLAMEAGICFLELRPYFFRSGYMFKGILRKCKRAPLSDSQAARFVAVIKKRQEWQAEHPRSYPADYTIKKRLTNRARFSK
jgi:hypothetical protein